MGSSTLKARTTLPVLCVYGWQLKAAKKDRRSAEEQERLLHDLRLDLHNMESISVHLIMLVGILGE